MKLILKYFLYNISNKKARSTIIVFSIMIITFLVIANLGINDYFMKMYRQNVTYLSGDVDAIIGHGEGKSEITSRQLKLYPEKIERTTQLCTAIGKTEEKNNKELKVQIIGGKLEDFKELKLLSTSSNHYGGIILSDQSLDLLGKKIGDRLSLTVYGQKYRYTITDIAKEQGIFATDDEKAITVLLPHDVVSRYYGTSYKATQMYIQLKEHEDVGEYIEQVKTNNRNITIDPTYSIEDYKLQMGAISLALNFILVLTIFISIYLISFLFKVMGSERVSIMGTFQSIGATSLTISCLFIGESLIYALLGFLLGGLLSIVALPSIYSILNQFQVTEMPRVTIQSTDFLIALIIDIGIALVSSLGVACSTTRTSLKDQIISTTKFVKEKNLASPLIGVSCFILSLVFYQVNKDYNMLLGILSFVLVITGGILLASPLSRVFADIASATVGKIFKGSFNLAMRNLKIDKFLQGNMTLIAIMITMILTIGTVIISVQDSMVSMLGDNDFDIAITNISSDLKDYRKIKNIKGVSDMYHEYLTFPKVKVADHTVGSLSLIGLSPNQSFKDYHTNGVIYNTKEAEKLQEGYYIMVDSFFADRNKLQIGDPITLVVEQEDAKEKEYEYEIIGLLDSSGFTTTRNAAMISLKGLKRNISNQPFQILIKGNGEDRKLLAQKISEELIGTSLKVKTIDQNIEESMQGVDGLIMVLGILMVLVFLLIGFGIINNLLVSFLQRKRQIAILSSIAMSHFQLSVMFFIEMMTLFLLSLGYSFALSYAIYKITPKMLWGAGLAFQFVYPWDIFKLIAGILFILLLILTILPSVELKRMKVIDELKYE